MEPPKVYLLWGPSHLAEAEVRFLFASWREMTPTGIN